jgi:hypothetical protein
MSKTLNLTGLKIEKFGPDSINKKPYCITFGDRIAFMCDLRIEGLDNGQALLHLVGVKENGFGKSAVIEADELPILEGFITNDDEA